MTKLRFTIIGVSMLIAIGAYPFLKSRGYQDSELIAWGTILAAVGALIYATFNMMILDEMQKQRVQSSEPRLYLDLLTMSGSTIPDTELYSHGNKKLFNVYDAWHEHMAGVKIDMDAATDSMLMLKIVNKGNVEVTNVSFKIAISIRHHDQQTQGHTAIDTFKINRPVFISSDETVYMLLGGVGEVPLGTFEITSFKAIDGRGMKVSRVNWIDPQDGAQLDINNSRLILLPEPDTNKPEPMPAEGV